MKIWNLTSLNGGDASEFDVILRWILNEELEFDVITDDDDDDEHSKVLLCSEKLSSAFNLNDDDDVLPIPKLNKDKEADVSVGRTGSTIMVAGWFYIPKLNDEELLGQDASFIYAKEQTIGVADGIIGGWSKRGIYSGEYSRELMKNSEYAVQNNDNSTTVDLMKVLNEAYSNTKAKGSFHCLDGLIVYKSEIQQSRFNCPYQLGNASSSDDPSVAEKISVPVVAGDVIVLGTDGLFDNVHDFELETLVNSGVDSLESDVPEILAWRIALYALDNAKSTELYMPFSRECSKVAINIVNKRLGVIDEMESVVSKRLGVIDDEMRIVIDDDDKDTAGVSVGVTGRTIMVAGTCYIPKLNKEKPLGQDASFICAKEQTIGVADGVGGWAEKGID
ncbi:hypothetical protein CQW23_02447 [Capsicum baccatum]|uniref:Protein phosphatase n=1 Tax=Capsicum baccatum TaxID=33114 RepID=A0A2G2XRG2_CAPBA|nr:hypothetical protein CQW23_02447 [Capsicum baccatum]